MKLLQFGNMQVSKKINIIVILAYIALAMVTAITVFEYRNSLYNDKKDKVKGNVEVAMSIIENYATQEKSGKITRDQAQSIARNEIKSLRYDGKNYFWIMDKDVNVIMHPTSAELDGKNAAYKKDQKGLALFVEMAKVANAKGEGYVRYYWNKPDKPKTSSFEKISFVKKNNDWGWIVGTGVYVDDVNSELLKALIPLAIMMILIVAVFWTISKKISADIKSAVTTINLAMTDVAKGSKVDKLLENRHDEFGEMAKSLKQMSNMLEQSKELERQNEIKNKQEAKRLLDENINMFEAKISPILNAFDASTIELTKTSDGLSNVVSDVSSRAQVVARTSSDTSLNISTVASATEEMSATANEISEQMSFFTVAMREAMNETAKADETSLLLDSATSRIGEVVAIIQGLAAQINLLALNATIESARAGEAGRGFAVVANEVKQLADQTEKATGEISTNIGNIREVASSVVAALGSIKGSIEKVESISNSISSAVEEQSAATRDIAHNMSMASTGTAEIDSSINQVSEYAVDASSAAMQSKSSAQNLYEQSQRLSNEIKGFINSVRAA